MAVNQIASIQRWIGLNADTKPTTPPIGSTFYETDTGDTYIYNGSWLLAYHQFNKVIVTDGAGHYVQLPQLTTTQRNALTAVNGMVIYNSTRNRIEVRVGGAWKDIGQVYGDATFLKLAGGEMSGNITFAGAETVDGVDVSAHAVDLDAHTRNLCEAYRTGEYVGMFSYVDTTGTLTADRIYAVPFLVARAMTIDRIAFEVTIADSGKSVYVGVFRDGVNLVPGARLVDGGEISVASTGIKAVTVDQALAKGIAWLVIASEGTPQIKFAYGYGMIMPLLGLNVTSLSQPILGWYGAHSYAALPAAFPSASPQLASCPCLTVRIASLD